MAASANFAVKITAQDATAGAFQAVAARMSALTGPSARLAKGVAQFSNATGVARLSRAVASLGASSVRAGVGLVEVLAPLSAITSAASLAGLGKLTADWARFSQGLAFDATRIGARVDDLQALEGSARLAGSSSSAAASGLRTLQDTMTDTAGGRSMEALVMFRQLGVAFDDGRGHALRATEVMPKLADSLARIGDRSIRARVGTALLGGAYENLAPWIDRGSKGMEEYAAMARHYGVETGETTARAKEFSFSQMRLALAFQGLGHSIAEQVSPPLSKMLTFLAELVGRNRELIGAKFGEWAKRFGEWVQAIDWEKVIANVGELYEKFKKWADAVANFTIPDALKTVMRYLGISVPGEASVSTGGPGSSGSDGAGGGSSRRAEDHMDNVVSFMKYFESQGWSHNQAAGIVANLGAESNFDPTAKGDNGNAYGIAQWHPDRQAMFKNWAGHDIQGSTLDEQMRFVQYELTHNEKAAGDALRATTSPAAASWEITDKYERPADKIAANRERRPYAEAISTVHVDVQLHGLPAGATATTTTSGAATSGVRIGRSMPQ